MCTAIALITGAAVSLKAADQPEIVSSASWLDLQSGMPKITVKDFKVQKMRDLPVPEDQRGFYLNVMQDCWTADIEDVYTDIELEDYTLSPDEVVFLWKHKIFETCENYVVTIVGLPCEDGKPPVVGRVVWMVPNIEFGYIQPGAEYIFWIWTSGIPEGQWDWFVVNECNDTNGAITPPLKDGDIDDVMGANLGFVSGMPLVYGPEPIEAPDPDPGGFPSGRVAGEESACRCWCFVVEDVPQCPSVEGVWDSWYNWFMEEGETCEDSIGPVGNSWIEFFSDGTFMTEEGSGGTWTQDNCLVNYVFDNGTHYWGTMTLDGSYIEGEMFAWGYLEGCWWSYRTKSKINKPKDTVGPSISGVELKLKR